MAEAGKARNSDTARAAILAAAQALFSQRGYPATSIRDIAGMAGYAGSLVMRYFGCKAGLFEAALHASIGQASVDNEPRDTYGARLAATMDETGDISLPLMIVLSAGDPEAAAITARITREHIIAPMALWLGGPTADSRAIRIVMLATGYVIYARQLAIGPTDAATRAALAANIQAIIDERG